MNKGFLLVVDGIDGSGKSTQIELLKKYLTEKGKEFVVFDFPRYEDNEYGKLIRRYLLGELGSINQVDPYLLSLAYAGDRALAKPEIEKALIEGKIVIANRYVSSNKAHMGAKLPDEKRQEFIDWVDRLEYQTNKLPKSNLTVFLNFNPEISQKLSGKQDIHEQDLEHLKKAQEIYLKLTTQEDNWVIVDCMQDSQIKSPEKIHNEIISLLEKTSIFH